MQRGGSVLRGLCTILIVGSGFLLAGPVLGEAAASSTETISLAEIERGQRGYGMSVFVGTEPSRFEVEVLGVLHHRTPELSYILARLSGQDLERSGVLGGMSGSPVYIDGRLAGAVAFGYLFGLDPIAGITPIAAMRRLAAAPAWTAMPAAVPLDLSLMDLLTAGGGGEVTHDSRAVLSEALAVLRPRLSDGAAAALQWSASGFGAPAHRLLAETVGALAPLTSASPTLSLPAANGGASIRPATAELVGGSAIAMVLVAGDLSLAAHGTLTERRGDEITAFGHPVFASPGLLPLAASEVITTIASRYNSFKLSVAGEVVGAFDQDREAGVRGRLGLQAPTFPLRVTVASVEGERSYQMEVAQLPLLSPALLAISSLGALTASTYSGGPQGIDLEASFALGRYGDLHLRQSFDGETAASDAVTYLLAFANFLFRNPLAKVEVEAVEVRLQQIAAPRTLELVAAWADRRRLEPGERLQVTLELRPHQGELERRRLELQVPDEAADGRYYFLLGDGSSMDTARLEIEGRAPRSFEDHLEQLRRFHSRRQLVVYGLVRAPGLALAGDSLPRLPGSVHRLLAGSAGRSAKSLYLAIDQQSVETLEAPISGAVRIDLWVERRP